MTGKRREFLSRIVADVGKLVLGSTVLKQILAEKVGLLSLMIGGVVAIILLVVSYFIEPGE